MLDEYLHGLEGYYFNRYIVPETLNRSYLDPNTSRGFQAMPNLPGIAKERLTLAYDYTIAGLEERLDKAPDLDRARFDDIHRKQVEDLRIYLNMRTDGAELKARAKGDFYGCSYNSYAKVVDLANRFWFFEQLLTGEKSKYKHLIPALRHVLHVPADEFLFANLKRMAGEYGLPAYSYNTGGMSILKSQEKYEETQAHVRAITDALQSKKYPGETMSPLVLDSFYAQANTPE